MVTPEPPKLQRRVRTAAEIAMKTRKHLVPVELLTALGWVRTPVIDEWRRGRTPDLEKAFAVDVAKVRTALEYLADWARENGLRPSEAAYIAATRDRRPLRFTASGGEILEKALRTHWVPGDLSEKRLAQLEARQNKAPDLVVVSTTANWTCGSCETRFVEGVLAFMENETPLCLSCADFGHLVFLPSGNAALSRRAKSESTLSAVVVEFNRRRKRYQRIGVLVEEAALEAAEQKCLADEDIRARRRERDAERRAAGDLEFQSEMTEAIVLAFPGCPPERAQRIAEHAAARGSGRVGRSAAGRALDPDAVRAAVVASVRHLDTDYDNLLMTGVPRADARERIRAGIDQVLHSWASPARP